MPRKIKVGLVGCGNIANQYVLGCRRYDVLEVVACASLNGASARAKAAEHGIPRACTVDELLAMPDVDIVVNLTIPAAHAAINEAALRAGKHVYAEKPFALNSHDGARALALAKQQGLLVGCAPDTFLGGGLQTARKLLDDGAIGRPVAAFAFMLCHTTARWVSRGVHDTGPTSQGSLKRVSSREAPESVALAIQLTRAGEPRGVVASRTGLPSDIVDFITTMHSARPKV